MEPDTPPNDAARVTTKGWVLEDILEKYPTFREVPSEDVEHMTTEQITMRIRDGEDGGIPLILKNWHKRSGWNAELFSPEWLKEHEGESKLRVRNLFDREDKDSTLSDYLSYASSASPHVKDDDSERLYAKDAKCPEGWNEWLQSNLPNYLLPFDYGDTGAHLSPEKRVETLMTYLGIGDTYTPGHKDSCASVGQNLMAYTADEDSSSFWFMTSTQDAHKASAYWRRLGQELDLESHLATLEELSKADFTVYVCQQKLGDFVLVPPRSCHQVVNAGGLTMKVAWSRMTTQSLSLALREELPIYQRVCRPEIYRVKETIETVLRTYVKSLDSSPDSEDPPESQNRLSKISFVAEMLPLFQRLVHESYDPNHEAHQIFKFDGESCDFCGACLWFCAMRCTTCIKPPAETSDEAQQAFLICPACYIDGRSCPCKIMEPVQTGSFSEQLDLENQAVMLLNREQRNGEPEVERVPLTEVDLRSHEDTHSEMYPPFFRAACFLYRKRKAYGEQGLASTRKCYVYRKAQVVIADQKPHDFFLDGGTFCVGCHASHCYYHILRRYSYHWLAILIHTTAYNSADDMVSTKILELEQWHAMHCKSIHTLNYYPDFSAGWKEWMPRLAWQFRPSRGLNPDLLKGWYDRDHDKRPEAIVFLDGPLKLQSAPIGKEASDEYEPQKDGSSKKRKTHPGPQRGRSKKIKPVEADTRTSSPDQLMLQAGPAPRQSGRIKTAASASASTSNAVPESIPTQVELEPNPAPKPPPRAPAPSRKSKRANQKSAATAAPAPAPAPIPVPSPSPVKALPFLSSFTPSKPISPRVNGPVSRSMSPNREDTSSPSIPANGDNASPLGQLTGPLPTMDLHLQETVRMLTERVGQLEDEKVGYLARIERLESEMNQVLEVLKEKDLATVEEADELDPDDEDHGEEVAEDAEAVAQDAPEGLQQQSSWRWILS